MPRASRLALAAAVCLATSSAGCQRRHAQETGAAQVALSGATLWSDVTRVTVTVSKGDGPDFTPIVQDLVKTGTDWGGYVEAIPPGPGRAFDVVAYDALGRALLAGSARSDIVAGGVATVLITLTPTPFGNAPVIDFLSASRTLVRPGETVVLRVSAHPRDPTDTISYQWSATCGSFDAPTTTQVTWTAPSAQGGCQLDVTVTAGHGGWIAAYVTILVQVGTGDASVNVTVAEAPVITAMTASVAFGSTVQGDLAVTATVPPGATPTFAWTSSCTSLTFDTQPPHGPATPHFVSADPSLACAITVTVSIPSGTHTTGVVEIPAAIAFDVGPVIQFTVQPSVDPSDPRRAEIVQPGEAVPLEVGAYDPEGQDLAFTWTASAGTLDGQVDQTTSPGGSAIVYHVPDPLLDEMRVTVTVADPLGVSNSHVFYFKPSALAGACLGQPDGTPCDDVDACTPGDACLAGICLGGPRTVCQASDQCHVAGICDAATGTCPNPPKNDGTPCNDANACTSADVCAAGVCAGAAVTCTAIDSCHDAGTCEPATGVCSSPSKPDGTTCNDGNACTTTDVCTGGVCGGTPLGCPGGGTCDPATGICPIIGGLSFSIVRELQILPPSGVAIDIGGNAYVAAEIDSLTAVSFDGHPVLSTGDADGFLAKYDTTGHAVWAVGFGDGLPNRQVATGAGVTRDGTVAVIGNFIGTLSIGSTISSASQIDFLAAVSASSGSGLWARQLNGGANGELKAVAANPNDATAHGNRIAVCGLASAAATDLVPGATYGGGRDIVIGVYTSTGTRLWSAQIGGAANEECDAISVDDNGDVYAAGKFDGATLAFGGATSPLTGPGVATRKFLWVAKFNGATGAAISAAAFGGAAGQATPGSVAADASGRLVVAGQFTSSLPFGGTTLTSAGGSDAFVAKLDPAAATPLAPVWAVRLGGISVDVANGVGVSSSGDVVVTGSFNRTTTGAAALVATGTTASDVFVLRLDGGTGATQLAAAYGDASVQTGLAIAVNRFGGNQLALAGGLDGSITFPAPAGAATATSGATEVFVVFGQVP